MVAQALPQRRIESFYTPQELETATPWRRLGGYALVEAATAATV